MGSECSVWFNTVLRGDVNSIRIGNRVNIQDGSVLHTLYQKSTIEIGDDVSIGHNVTIHGAKIHNFALIGMGAVVMDDAEVGEGALVAAGSVVLSRTKIGPNELWGGAPAKFIKMVDPTSLPSWSSPPGPWSSNCRKSVEKVLKLPPYWGILFPL